MKAFINAYGTVDSLGNDRSTEPRGLIRIGGKPVIQHTLDRLAELDLQEPVLLCVNANHREIYEKALRRQTRPRVEMRVYKAENANQLLVYLARLRELGSDHVLALADDNIFDFSLQGLVDRFYEVDDNVVAVRDISALGIPGEEDLNFGRCEHDESGRITNASYSFCQETRLAAGKVLLDIHVIHRRWIPHYEALWKRGEEGLLEGMQTWWNGFYVWEPANGFWADVGKSTLRERAEMYFLQQQHS
jgi:NDP-sugar pyrophosphorylase family protein